MKSIFNKFNNINRITLVITKDDAFSMVPYGPFFLVFQNILLTDFCVSKYLTQSVKVHINRSRTTTINKTKYCKSNIHKNIINSLFFFLTKETLTVDILTKISNYL